MNSSGRIAPSPRADLPPADIRKYKLVFLGDQGSGKTSIIQRAIDDTFPRKYNATVGVDFVSKTMRLPGADDASDNNMNRSRQQNNDTAAAGAAAGGATVASAPTTNANNANAKKSLKLQLWDTAGQERFKASIPSYIRDSHVAVVTFDITNRQQFDNVTKWIDQVRDIRGDDTVVWLVATKVDLPLYERKVSWLEMEDLAVKHKLEFMEVSAKAGYNIRELFYEMTQKLPNLQGKTELSNNSARF